MTDAGDGRGFHFFELNNKQTPIPAMPHDSLSLEERLSPIKLAAFDSASRTQSDEIQRKVSASADLSSRSAFGLIKHPHGLQAKHEYRRNTLNHPSSFKTPAKPTTRDVVTSPRLVAPVLQPDNTDSIADSPSYRIRSKRVTEKVDNDSNPLLIGNGNTKKTQTEHNSNKRPSSGEISLSVFKQSRLSSAGKSHGANTSDSSFHNELLERMNSSPENINHGDDPAMSLTEKQFGDDLMENHDSRILESNQPGVIVHLNDTPIYTAHQMEMSRQSLLSEIVKMEASVVEKNDEIIELTSAVSNAKNRILRLEEGINEKLRAESHLKESVHLLDLQIDHINKELSQVKLDLKVKSALLQSSEDKLKDLKEGFDEERRTLNDTIVKLEGHAQELEVVLAERSLEISTLKAEIEGIKLEKERLFRDRDSLSVELEKILASNESLLSKLKAAEDEREHLALQLQMKERSLSEKNDQLKDLDEKFKELCEEASSLHNEMAKLETEQKSKDEEILKKDHLLEQLKVHCTQLEGEITSLKDELKSNRDLYQKDTNITSSLQSEIDHLMKKVEDLQNQNLEKDQIISGDTKKLTELVEEVTKQKQVISELKTKVTNKDESASETELLRQIASLKHQVSTAQQKTDERIQDVAEQLYHQYSKKHELKVNQLKEKYDAKIEDSHRELEQKRREIETLDSQLKTEMKEKNYLLSVLEKSDSTFNKRTPTRNRY